jgi:hypothetical protein
MARRNQRRVAVAFDYLRQNIFLTCWRLRVSYHCRQDQPVECAHWRAVAKAQACGDESARQQRFIKAKTTSRD